jgi:hypothetical protein
MDPSREGERYRALEARIDDLEASLQAVLRDTTPSRVGTRLSRAVFLKT